MFFASAPAIPRGLHPVARLLCYGKIGVGKKIRREKIYLVMRTRTLGLYYLPAAGAINIGYNDCEVDWIMEFR